MLTFAASFLLSFVSVALADDRIVNLPGWNGTQNMWAGYINVNVSHGRNLYYWLVEAQINPDTAPLVLWTNGGPGCSGLSGGLFSEFGPFFPNPDGSLSLIPNTYTWTQKANVIFIEQPSGVGFSWSATTQDYTTGDYQSAEDVYQFLLGFIQRYPQYAQRPLYLSGESYAGHYTPTEAAAIVRGNNAGINPRLNLQGFLVGNSWTQADLDNTGAIDFWYTRSMIDKATHDGVLATCNMSDVGPLFVDAVRRGVISGAADWEESPAPPRPLGFTPKRDPKTGKATLWASPSSLLAPTDCDGWTNQAFGLLNGVNIYDIFVDVCPTGGKRKSRVLAEKAVGSSGTLGEGSNNAAGCANNYDPCIDDFTTTYLNNPTVKAAIHANASITWQGCSDIVNYSRFDLLTSMLPVYNFLFSAGLRILVFSGDVDAIVPTLGTKAWLSQLNLTEKESIRAWTVGGQVGGWVTSYDQLTFATVRNAGHMVPSTQGERGLYLVQHFLDGTPL